MLLPINMNIVILAGGSGTRLWPLSRKHFPKQYLKFKELNEKSLFQLTFLRAIHINQNVNEIFIVTNQDQKFLVMNEIEQLNINFPEENILIEPKGKNTFPAIAFAMQFVDKQALILSSDHLIKNEKVFYDAVNKAKELSPNFLTIFGITPTSAHTGYGYIKFNKNTLEVEKFIEKPDIKKAKEYIQNGFIWNAGIFLFNKELFLKEVKKYNEKILNLIKKKDLEKHYEELEDISIDYAILEKCKNIKVIPTKLEWTDLGSFDSISEEFSKTTEKNYSTQNKIIDINSKNNFISAKKDKITALCDVNDLIVIDTDDALLICKKNSSNNVKPIIEKLKEKKDERLLIHTTAYRPWGSYTVLEDKPTHKVKRLTVLPKKILSLQSHNHRAEHWTVVKGEAYVVIGEKEMILKQNQSTYIPKKSKHRLGNKTNQILEIIETQTGDYFGEDDIIRYEDEYNRK